MKKEKNKLRKRKKDSLTLILLIIFLNSCITQPQITEPKEINKPIEVYFCPEDDCEESVISIIDSAEDSVHCAFFDLDLKELISSLRKKADSIDVKLVIDSDNYFNQTKRIPTVLDDNNQLTHNKFCIIDEKKILTGSFNPTDNGNTRNNNNLLIISSRFLAENYEDEFKELWNKEFGEGAKNKNTKIEYNYKKIENYFCPEDLCSQHIINKILKANSSIYFMIFTFTDKNIADAILMSEAKDIKGVMEKMQANGAYSQYKRLKGFNIPIRVDSNPGMMHHKVFIIDNETVITGSYNPTSAGDKKNDENILIIHSKKIAEKYIDEFWKIFNISETS